MSQVAGERLGGRVPDLFDYSPVPHLVLDPAGSILGVNLAGAKLLGFKRKALLEEPLTRFIEPDDQPDFHEHLHTLIHRRTVHSCDIRFRNREGALIHALIQSMPVPDDFGQVLGFHTSITDIGRQKEKEEKYRTGR